MPLSNIERQVLKLVCSEGKKCRGGVPTPTVTRLLAPYNPSATVGTLHVLKSEGLLSVTGADEHSRGWVATTKGEAALREAETAHDYALKRCVYCQQLLTEGEAEFLLYTCNECEYRAHQKARQGLVAQVNADKQMPDDLLDRCAAMNATLLAQAEQAHAAGDIDAWRDLAWLMETGRQLVAIGGAK